MDRLRQYLTSILLSFSLVIAMSGCSFVPMPIPTPIRFTVQLDESDTLTYSFGGGELGADATGVFISGDGHVTYRFTPPYNDDALQEETITREHQLTLAETEQLFQTFEDAGLFDLADIPTAGADVPRTTIKASFDGHMVEASMDMDRSPSEIDSQIRVLLAEIDPERYGSGG